MPVNTGTKKWRDNVIGKIANNHAATLFPNTNYSTTLTADGYTFITILLLFLQNSGTYLQLHTKNAS